MFSSYFSLFGCNNAGIFVAYSAPHRHGFLKVVENNYCTSRRGIFSSFYLRCIWLSMFMFCIFHSLVQ